MRNIVAAAVAGLLLLTLQAQAPNAAAAPAAPAAQALHLRMQRVLSRFVEETGQSVMGVGSWISGTTFNPATSDFDMRLVVEEGLGPTQQAARWRDARVKLTALIRDEFGGEAGKLISRTNVYPPNQLMAGVEDTADALERFQRLNTVPSLAYSGPVNARTPVKYAEGLYGAGAQTYVQGYERKAGRLFYNNNGRAVTGLSELAHLGETGGTYTARGTASTAGQWAEHALNELQAGHGDKVAKYLDRLERDLVKSRSLSGLPIDQADRAQLTRMRDLLKTSPGRLSEVGADVSRVLARGRAEAAILGSIEAAGPVRRAYLGAMLDGVAASNRLGGLIDRVLQKLPASVDAMRAIDFLGFAVGARATAQSLGSGDDAFKTLSALFGSLGPVAGIGPALLLETVTEIMAQAKQGGYELAASSQEAWDLMAGIYSAWGRAGLDPDPRRKLSVAELVARYPYERQVEALVMAQAQRAATRGLGSASAQADDGVAQAIFARCWPVIRDAWRWQRDVLASEFLTLASTSVHTPLVVYFKPAQPRTREPVHAEAASVDRTLGNRIERMTEIIRVLYGSGSGVRTAYTWAPAGSVADGRDYQRQFSFAEPGTHAVTVMLTITPYTSHTQAEPRLLLAREVAALVDVEVEGSAMKVPASAAAGPAVSKLARAYLNATVEFNASSASYSFPGRPSIDIGSGAENPGQVVPCPGALSGRTYTCAGRASFGDLSKSVKATFVFSPNGDAVESFTFESDIVDTFDKRAWKTRLVGANIPKVKSENGDWDAFALAGPEVCKRLKVTEWSMTWPGGASKLTGYNCARRVTLDISMGTLPVGKN